MFSENSLVFFFFGTCKELNCSHEGSSPHGSKTHGIAVRAVRRVKEGTSSAFGSAKAGGQKRWSVIASFEMCKAQ